MSHKNIAAIADIAINIEWRSFDFIPPSNTSLCGAARGGTSNPQLLINSTSFDDSQNFNNSTLNLMFITRLAGYSTSHKFNKGMVTSSSGFSSSRKEQN